MTRYLLTELAALRNVRYYLRSHLKVDCSPHTNAALHAGGPTLQGQATETAAVQGRVQQHRVTERHAAGLADRARGEAAGHFEESTRAPGSEEGRGRRC